MQKLILLAVLVAAISLLCFQSHSEDEIHDTVAPASSPPPAAAKEESRRVRSQKSAKASQSPGKYNNALTKKLYAVDGPISLFDYNDAIALIKKGANVDPVDSNGFTPFLRAVSQNDEKVVEFLVRLGCRIDARNTLQQSALHLAAEIPSLNMVRLLVKLGVPVDITGDQGQTALHYAAFDDSVDILEFLLASGADADARTHGNETALVFAAYKEHLSAYKYLLEHSADPNIVDKSQRTTLHVVMETRRLTVNLCKFLLYNSERNQEDFEEAHSIHSEILQWTNLTWAQKGMLAYGRRDCLLATSAFRIAFAASYHTYGGNLNARNIMGRTALHLSSFAGDDNVVAWLLSHGVDVDVVDHHGSTALHLASLNGGERIVEMLVLVGADLTARDASGYTAYDLAVRKGHRAIASLVSPIAQDAVERDLQQHEVPRERFGPIKKATTKNSGGWTAPSLPRNYSHGFCNIPRISSLTSTEFLRDYAHLNRPFLLSIKNEIDTWPARKKWAKRSLMGAYGGDNVQVSDIPYGPQFGVDGSVVALRDYVDTLMGAAVPPGRSPPYVFITPAADSGFNNDFRVPSPFQFSNVSSQFLQWTVGPATSGSPVHFHNDAWNAVVYGRKRWFLFPPAVSFYSKEPIGSWIDNHYQHFAGADDNFDTSRQYFECVQDAGEIMYVPSGWGHGVMNLADTVAIALEFNWEMHRS